MDLLRSYYGSTGKKPERLIFYRDGVSEGQFPEVQRFEIAQVIAACRELGRGSGEDYSPPVTFVVAQKRQNTRFFPTREADKSGNIPPGVSLPMPPTHTPIFCRAHSHAHF